MHSAWKRAPFLVVEFADAHSEPGGAAGSGSGLQVTAATGEGTPAALRVASSLAQNLGARTGLMVPGVVPFCFRLDKPPGPIDFLERRAPVLVSESDTDESDSDEPDIEESDIDAEESNIEFLTKSLAFHHEILMPLLCLIYGPSRKLGREGVAVTYLPVTGDDRMMLDRVQKLGTQTKDLLEQQGFSLAPKRPPQ
jgi:hypothetical protein